MPDVLKFRNVDLSAIPDEMYVQLVIARTSDSSVDVLKHIVFGSKVTREFAQGLCRGSALACIHKPSIWNVKKTYAKLMETIPGKKMLYQSCRPQQARAARAAADGEAQSAPRKWSPDEDEIKAGFEYIQKNCPAGYEANDVLQFVVAGIHVPGTPIHGWPMSVVEKACNNLVKKADGADAQFFSPFVASNKFDFKGLFALVLFPLVVALGRARGLLVLGRPGVGKTPWAIALALAFGRYHVRKSELRRRPGFRRGGMIDVFRQKPGEVQEAILLDDPTFDKIHYEDVKSFGDSGFQGHSDCRYTPSKWAKNQFRAILSNTWRSAGEPAPNDAATVSPKEFFPMIRDTFGTVSESNFMAIMKRYTTVVVGNNAVYVRPPTDDVNGKVHRFSADGVMDDFLVPGHKKFYGLHLLGDDQKYPDYDKMAEDEQKLMDKIFAAIAGFSSEGEVVQWWDEKVRAFGGLQDNVFEVRNNAPPSPPSPEVATHVAPEADGSYAIPPTAPTLMGARRRWRRFRSPPRARSARSPTPA